MQEKWTENEIEQKIKEIDGNPSANTVRFSLQQPTYNLLEKKYLQKHVKKQTYKQIWVRKNFKILKQIHKTTQFIPSLYEMGHHDLAWRITSV